MVNERASFRFYLSSLYQPKPASFLFGALVLYAFAGSPTPDSPGIVEGLIAILLILAMGTGGFICSFIFFDQKNQAPWVKPAQMFLFYGLSIPLILGIAFGHGAVAVARDAIPFLFLLLPLFFMKSAYAEKDARFSFLLLSGFILIGLVFSWRSLWQFFNFDFAQILPGFESDELLYLSNSPAVLFSAVFFILSAGMVFVQNRSGSFLRMVFYAFLAVIPVLAMALTIQRASMVAIFISVLIALGFVLRRKPVLGIILTTLSCTVLISHFDFLQSVATIFLEKTKIYGSNMRIEEMKAVWDQVSGNFLTLIFGLGWGASFASPAVGEIPVQFTHNFFSSILLKMGLCGLFLAVIYITALARHFFRNWGQNVILSWAVFWPLLIDLSVYASFKSLDFGLLLCLLAFAHCLTMCESKKEQKRKSEPHEAEDPIYKPGVSAA